MVKKKNPPFLQGLLGIFFMFLFVLFIKNVNVIYRLYAQTGGGKTTITIHVFLHGIGRGGDRKDPQSIGNNNPINKTRTATVSLYDDYNNFVVKKDDVTIHFDSSAGNFSGSFTLDNIPTGNYSVIVKTRGFLSRQVGSPQFITNGQTNSLDPVTLQNGDLKNTDVINIEDYNMLVGCFGSRGTSPGCLDKNAADINNDGVVDGVDFNLFLREFAIKEGDVLSPMPTPTNTPTPTPTPTPTEIPGPPTTIQNIVPLPVSVHSDGGRFGLTNNSAIYVNPGSSEVTAVGHYLADKLNPATGFSIQVKTASDQPGYGNIYLTTSGADSSLGPEGYQLTVVPSGVTVVANQPEGLFRGIQTIRQMFPPSIDSPSVQNGPWIIPTGTIRDYPRYSWRGVMLDVARHFFGVGDVERLIDESAYYKMNVIHLHLTDDQGWRIQIKSRPALTNGGTYYTQSDYAAIVNYAKERYITIVPEMDMPGHSYAARAAYPELNCGGGDNLCVYSDATYSFVDDVIREVASLTPGRYIHIGGDESSLSTGAYDTFMNHVIGIISSHGKHLIGWDETARAALSGSTATQYWINYGYLQEAANKGSKIVMSPVCHAYIDFSYFPGVPDGPSFVGSCPYVNVRDSYDWDPSNQVVGVTDASILGLEVPLWSETVYSMSDIEFMTFPRAIDTAEIGWSQAGGRWWNEYKYRLGSQGPRLREMGVHFYASPEIPWQ